MTTDILIVNPPSPDGHVYIRDVCRWGRRSRERMIWPQTSLAYIAAMVPEDMSVVGYDDITMAAYLLPPLTTLRQFKRDLGAGAANMMLRVVDTRDPAGPQPDKISFKGELVIRASTAPIAHG